MTEPPVHVELTPRFVKIVKRLRKKYPSVTVIIGQFMEILAQGETPGDQIQGVGYTAYKARQPNPDSQRGKRGGYRIIYYIRTPERVILLLIYAKTSQVDIHPEEIRHLIDEFENP